MSSWGPKQTPSEILCLKGESNRGYLCVTGATFGMYSFDQSYAMTVFRQQQPVS